MADALFRLACSPRNLDGAPDGWVESTLEDGELALLVDDGGLDAISALTHALDVVTARLLRPEETAEAQERTVMRYAGSMALVWIAPAFSDAARKWAHDRGPMSLLVEASEPLSADERKRVERFVVILGRQAE
jgi:hypothetical protein